jgi:hypothetical protein
LFQLKYQTNLDFEVVGQRYVIVNKSRDQAGIETLDRVILTSYLSKGISKNKNASYQIRSTRLGILPGLTESDVLESIQLLTGVVSPNETASGFLVRGGKMD